MILQDTMTDTNIDVETKQYSIKKSPIAYQILYDKLYDNPYKAVIRELVTNAYDSQVKNGNPDTPIDIRIPSYVDSKFYIRDYGTGLSKQEVLNLYTTFFESDKRDTNEFTGCFGLGSKSPFAISDGFTVTSYYNGIKYTYLNVKKDGYPSIFLTREEPTDEPNGLAITIPVKEKDITPIKNNLKYLKYLPEVKIALSDENIQLNATQILVHGVFTFYKPDTYGYNRILYIKQGQTVIPLESKSSFNDIVSKFDYLASLYDVVMEVPIGSVEISPSREHIAESEDNIQFLKEYTNTHYNELVKHFKTISPAKCPPEHSFLFEYIYQNEFHEDSNRYLHLIKESNQELKVHWRIYGDMKYWSYSPDTQNWLEGDAHLRILLSKEIKYTVILNTAEKRLSKIKKIVKSRYPDEHCLIIKPFAKNVSDDTKKLLQYIHHFFDSFQNDPRFPVSFNIVTSTKFLNDNKDFKIPRSKRNTAVKNTPKSIHIQFTTIKLVPNKRSPDIMASTRMDLETVLQYVNEGKAVLMCKEDSYNGVTHHYLHTMLSYMQHLMYKGRHVLYDFLKTKNPNMNRNTVYIYYVAKSHKNLLDTYPSITLKELHDYFINEGVKFDCLDLALDYFTKSKMWVKTIESLNEKYKQIVYDSKWFKKRLMTYKILYEKLPSLVFDNDAQRINLLKAFFKDCPYKMFNDLTKYFDPLFTFDKASYMLVTPHYNRHVNKSFLGINKHYSRSFLSEVLRRSYVFHKECG